MRKVYTAISLVLVLALGVWLGLVGTASAQRNAPPRSHVTAAHRAVHASSESSGEDTDQSGSEQSSESTSPNETDTHQDPNEQDVNHECPPNCETASGEQP